MRWNIDQSQDIPQKYWLLAVCEYWSTCSDPPPGQPTCSPAAGSISADDLQCILSWTCPLPPGNVWTKVMLPPIMDDVDTKVQPHCLYLGQLQRAVPHPQLPVESAEASDAATLGAQHPTQRGPRLLPVHVPRPIPHKPVPHPRLYLSASVSRGSDLI